MPGRSPARRCWGDSSSEEDKKSPTFVLAKVTALICQVLQGRSSTAPRTTGLDLRKVRSGRSKAWSPVHRSDRWRRSQRLCNDLTHLLVFGTQSAERTYTGSPKISSVLREKIGRDRLKAVWHPKQAASSSQRQTKANKHLLPNTHVLTVQ